MSTKPIFLCFPGAWHSADHFNLAGFLAKLNDQGYETATATLASMTSLSDGLLADIDFIKQKMNELFQQDRDVILALHSYAGRPGCIAVKGASKAERKAQGLPGGLIGTILLAGVIPIGGLTGISLFPGEWPEWWKVNEETKSFECGIPRDLFYADVPEPLATQAVNLIVPMSFKTLEDVEPPVVIGDQAFDGRRAYIRTLKDVTMNLDMQNAMMEGSGVSWLVKDVDTGHSPFLVEPDELARLFVEILKEFRSA